MKLAINLIVLICSKLIIVNISPAKYVFFHFQAA